MSFLLRTLPRQSSRFIPATTATRAFSTTLLVRKSATEAVKDTVKSVDRAVSDKLVDGIEAGRMSSSILSSSLPLPPNHTQCTNTFPQYHAIVPLYQKSSLPNLTLWLLNTNSPPNPPSHHITTTSPHTENEQKLTVLPQNRNTQTKSRKRSRHVSRRSEG